MLDARSRLLVFVAIGLGELRAQVLDELPHSLAALEAVLGEPPFDHGEEPIRRPSVRVVWREAVLRFDE